MKLKILTGALALLLTGSVLTGFSTQAAPSKAESDDHLAQEISGLYSEWMVLPLR